MSSIGGTPQKKMGKPKTKTWADIFGEIPGWDVDISLQFLKRFTYFTMIQIIGCRRMVHAKALRKEAVEGHDDFRIFTLRRTDFVGQRCHTKLIGIFESIEREFLKEFIIVASNNDNDEDDAIEVYTMRFAYSGRPSLTVVDANGKSVVEAICFEGSDKLKVQAMSVLERIYKLAQVLDRLPAGTFCSFRASYYDETPDEFVPVGWYPTTTLYTFDHPDAIDSFNIAPLHLPKAAAFLSVKSAYIHDELEVEERMEHGFLDACNDGQNSFDLNKSADMNITTNVEEMSKMFRDVTDPVTGRAIVVPTTTPAESEPGPNATVRPVKTVEVPTPIINNNNKVNHVEPVIPTSEEDQNVGGKRKTRGRQAKSSTGTGSGSHSSLETDTINNRGRGGKRSRVEASEPSSRAATQPPTKQKMDSRARRLDKVTPPATQPASPTY